MTRPAELFAIAALVLLVLRELGRTFLTVPSGFAISIRGTGYVFPPESVAIVVATFLCFFAAIYSLSLLPFNVKAGLWHFWITSVGLAFFWICFYLVPVVGSGTSGFGKAAVWGWFVSALIVLLVQVLFVVNLVYSLAHLPRFLRL